MDQSQTAVHIGLPVQPTKDEAWWPWLWPFDLESGVQVTCDVGTSVPILVFLGLSVLDLGLMYVTNVRQRHCL